MVTQLSAMWVITLVIAIDAVQGVTDLCSAPAPCGTALSSSCCSTGCPTMSCASAGLSGALTTSTFQSWPNPHQVTKVDFSSNAISSVESHSLDVFASVAILLLDQNAITYIAADAFETLSNLQQIKLDGNNLLGQLPQALFVALVHLQSPVNLDMNAGYGLACAPVPPNSGYTSSYPICVTPVSTAPRVLSRQQRTATTTKLTTSRPNASEVPLSALQQGIAFIKGNTVTIIVCLGSILLITITCFACFRCATAMDRAAATTANRMQISINQDLQTHPALVKGDEHEQHASPDQTATCRSSDGQLAPFAMHVSDAAGPSSYQYMALVGLLSPPISNRLPPPSNALPKGAPVAQEETEPHVDSLENMAPVDSLAILQSRMHNQEPADMEKFAPETLDTSSAVKPVKKIVVNFQKPPHQHLSDQATGCDN